MVAGVGDEGGIVRVELGPLYVNQDRRRREKRVLSRGSPTAADVPSNRVNCAVTRSIARSGLIDVGVEGAQEVERERLSI